MKQKHGLAVGDLRSHLGAVSKLCELMQYTSSSSELTHKMRELSHVAPEFLLKSKFLGHLSLPGSQSYIKFGI